MLEENLSHMVLVHYRDVKGEKRKARYIEETESAEGVQHSRKTDEITPNSKMDSFASSSFNPSKFQHSLATDGTNLNSAPTSESENTESACDDCRWESFFNNTVTTGFSGIDEPGLFDLEMDYFGLPRFVDTASLYSANSSYFGDDETEHSFADEFWVPWEASFDNHFTAGLSSEEAVSFKGFHRSMTPR
ncbi:uncharacterized protein LOC125468234 [Pyrus x bretschneideri]|uniref:uncharacterized protein LOC125468234 n=1 Tax=Pyrus x bretschneideri TaxID=225117 RepID=UPI002030E543|nr:uncharacterized protein LOC125468234 [Pyrus x bretschneideri]